MLFKTLSLFFLPSLIFADPSYLYVGNQAPNQLVEYDTSMGISGSAVLLYDGLPISQPSGMTLNSDGSILYIASAVNTSLLSYDINIDALSTLPITGDTLTGCYGIVFVPGDSSDDMLYVADYGNNTFFSYNLSTTILTAIPTAGSLSNPTALTLSFDKTTIYILNSGNNTIVAYDLTNQTFTPLAVTPDMTNPGTLNAPYGSELSADGSILYICNFGSNELDAYNIGSTTLTNLNPIPAILNGPVSVASNSNGTALYIANILDSQISLYEIGSNSLTNLTFTDPSLISQPRCLALPLSAPPPPPPPPPPTPPVISPPTGLTGYQNKNDFGLIYGLTNEIYWKASTSNNVAGYNVYKNGTLIATLGAFNYKYTDHNIQKGSLIIYSVSAFNSEGDESDLVSIQIP